MNTTTLKKYWLFSILFFLFFLASCSTSKKTTKSSNAVGTAEDFLDHMIKNQVQADWVYGKMRLQYADDYMSVSGTGTIQMKKDSLIWISIKKLGFEVARVQITPDSVYAINRLGNEYYIKSLDYIEDAYNIPASLQLLQTLVLGNPVFFQRKDYTVSKEEGFFLLNAQNDSRESQYWLHQANRKMHKMAFDDFRNNRQMEIQQLDYNPTADQQNFSYLRKMDFRSGSTGSISMEVNFTKIEFNNPRNIRFVIPERYKRVE